MTSTQRAEQCEKHHEGHSERVGRHKELQGAGQPEESDVRGHGRHSNPQYALQHKHRVRGDAVVLCRAVLADHVSHGLDLLLVLLPHVW